MTASRLSAMTLAEFLNARLDETEARAGKPRTWTVDHHDCEDWHCDQPCEEAAACEAGDHGCGGCSAAISGSGGMTIYAEGGHTLADAEHIAAHDPARVLREVEATRELLRHLTDPESGDLWRLVIRLKNLPDCALPADWLIRPFAAIWSDHPDYHQDWKP